MSQTEELSRREEQFLENTLFGDRIRMFEDFKCSLSWYKRYAIRCRATDVFPLPAAP